MREVRTSERHGFAHEAMFFGEQASGNTQIDDAFWCFDCFGCKSSYFVHRARMQEDNKKIRLNYMLKIADERNHSSDIGKDTVVLPKCMYTSKANLPIFRYTLKVITSQQCVPVMSVIC